MKILTFCQRKRKLKLNLSFRLKRNESQNLMDENVIKTKTAQRNKN